MKTISSEDALLLFSKWKGEHTPVNFISKQAGGIGVFLKGAFISKCSEAALLLTIGEFGTVLIGLIGAVFEYLEPHELPNEAFTESGAQFDSIVRVGLPGGEPSLLFEMRH